MDKKINKLAENAEKINDELYADHDETLKQHDRQDEQVDKLQTELLKEDMKYDRKKHKAKVEA